jgi:hypothetical protein
MPRIAFLIFILTLLCACVPATAGQGKLPTGLATPKVGEATPKPPVALVPTATRVEATATTANTPTPEATATSEVFVYNKERAKTEDQFTPVTDGQKQTIIAGIENSWVLDENSTASFHLSPLHVYDGGASYIRLNVMYGQNCIVRASIVQDVSIQGNIYKIYQYVWELIVNEQHRVLVTNHSTGILYPESEKKIGRRLPALKPVLT